MTQTQISLSEPGSFIAESGPAPETIPPGHAKLRVRRIGVCGTDIHAFYGRQPFFEYPRILGHELGAEILEINGDSCGLTPGQLVAVEPYLNNPDSPASRRGKTNCCEELQVLGIHTDGGMRPEIVVPTEKLHPSVSANADQLALVEMLCIGAHAVDRAQIEKDEFAVVLGAGPIGMSVLQFLKTKTNRAAVADLDAGRLEFCKNGLGIPHSIQVEAGQSIENKLRDLGDGDLPTVIFDVTGHPGSMMGCFDLIGHGGTIVFVGLFQGDVTFNDPNFHRREITLKSSRNAPSETFGDVIRAIETGVVDTEPWITHRMELDEIPERFEKTITSPGMRKSVIHVAD